MFPNTLGPFLLIQKLVPMMIGDGYGRIVNISSGMGQLSEMNQAYAAYRISKTALNTVTKGFAEETKDKGDILVNSVCPGWVQTDMGGPTGGFFRDGERLDW